MDDDDLLAIYERYELLGAEIVEPMPDWIGVARLARELARAADAMAKAPGVAEP